MRLIDADALNKELQKRVGSPTEEKLYEANLCIIDAPTIDAIPVEWLKQMEWKCAADVQKVPMFIAIGWLIDMWQKEQEAR